MRLNLLRWFSAVDKFNYYLVVDSELFDQPGRLMEILEIDGWVEAETWQLREIGPKFGWVTPWSTQVMTIFGRLGIKGVARIERVRRVNADQLEFDQMTEMVYPAVVNLEQFLGQQRVESVQIVSRERWEQKFDGFEQDLLAKIQAEKGYLTDVEVDDLAQSNSEHSRHWLFRGKLIDQETGEAMELTLMDLIKIPLQINQTLGKDNSLIAIRDNSSAIRGGKIDYLRVESGKYRLGKDQLLHPIFTAETHNFPTGIAPFEGATTGTGGRIRDIQSIGRGGLMMAGTAGYCVGNLDQVEWDYPIHCPEKTLIRASDGASDYGNKIGEPLINGFCRDFGLKFSQGDNPQRIEWIKPIMFSGGVGQMFDQHLEKQKPEWGSLITRIGGLTYRIGVGGGSASSQSQGDDLQEAVQRGDPEMENRMNRVVRALIELGDSNPIKSIHDQGAGGMGNVIKEIVSPIGGLVSLANVAVGDPSLSAREKWIAESQEQNCLLIDPSDAELVKQICQRENCPVEFVGVVFPSGRIQVVNPSEGKADRRELVVNLDLNQVLEDLGQKEFEYRVERSALAGQITVEDYDGYSMAELVEKVFGLVSVGSKRFLVNKVDRSVGGLTVQQQAVGPLETPIANLGVVAQSFWGVRGIATANGEQPLIGLVSPRKMARMAVGEMLTNLVWARISGLEDVKCSGNWMWEKKYPEELGALKEAVESLSQMMVSLGIAIDGGKDSLSMSAKLDSGQEVLCPRQLVISGYVGVPDITKVVTPDLKKAGSWIMFVNLGHGYSRLGGSALAQALNLDHLGSEEQMPDLEDPDLFRRVFEEVQFCLDQGWILSGHDRSDGGLITCVAEIAIAGDLGIEFISDLGGDVPFWFNQELGLVIEVSEENLERVGAKLENWRLIGRVIEERVLRFGQEEEFELNQLRSWWEKRSSRLELAQTEQSCVEQEYGWLGEKNNLGLRYRSEFASDKSILDSWVRGITSPGSAEDRPPKVGILREEGSNGDREMASAFMMAGFQVYDLTTQDLLNGFSLRDFRGLVLVGGFSFSDVLGAGRGWFLSLNSKTEVRAELEEFRDRPNTFSLGICNGCQVMAQLGWIPGVKLEKNLSGRFESRWSRVKINDQTNSIMLKGLKGRVLGVWTAHAEGRFSEGGNQIAVQYCDFEGEPTQRYPFNPNGSINGIAGLCSADGRHLGMMPHPERSILRWQVPIDKEYNCPNNSKYSFWFEMFVQAREWCRYK